MLFIKKHEYTNNAKVSKTELNPINWALKG